eukprot:CAMPEP_0171495840 /NCGR_PEP_ID=MMETSP0958-20121227/6363_1 /TAXON_ID=87120 /ORGANISM="Aurantiochytrium limacinum, Strain ATCCMYA-1381" /LENGTH=663 /DNA_ID=CAMNT_0012029863 /DNA_START=268 /DNA_END=2259 /DNA_ORIENTATION=+
MARAAPAMVALLATISASMVSTTTATEYDNAVRFTYICRYDGGDSSDDSFGPCMYASSETISGTSQTSVYAGDIDSTDLDGGSTQAELDKEYGWKVYFTGNTTNLTVEIEHNYTDGGLDIGGKYHNQINIMNISIDHTNGKALAFTLVDGLPDSWDGPYQLQYNSKCLAISDASKVHLGNCSLAESKLRFVDYVVESFAPTSAPAPTTDDYYYGTSSPTSDTDLWTRKVILLASSYNDRYHNGLLLGLGISSGSNPDLRPALKDKLQLKSLVKNYFKDSDGMEEYKMLWDHDNEYRLGLTRPANESKLYMQSRKRLSALNSRPIDTYGYVELASSTDKDKQKFHFISNGNATAQYVKIIIGDSPNSEVGDFSSKDLCLTVASCDPWSEDTCRPNSNHVGCENTCDDSVSATLEGVVNGSYVKLASCKSAYDEAQLFVLTTTAEALNLFSDAPTVAPTMDPTVSPTVQPTTAAPTTAAPTTAAPTTALPTTVTTAQPTTAPPTTPPTDDSTDRATDPDSGSATASDDSGKDRSLMGLFALFALIIIAIILVFAVRRRRRRERERRAIDEGGWKENMAGLYDDDDDDQDLYNSFDTPSQSGSSDDEHPRTTDTFVGVSKKTGAGERRAKTTNALEQPMINKRSNSMSFEPHVAHFEQEAGFVARV